MFFLCFRMMKIDVLRCDVVRRRNATEQCGLALRRPQSSQSLIVKENLYLPIEIKIMIAMWSYMCLIAYYIIS
jgi:hypothetical protein